MSWRSPNLNNGRSSAITKVTGVSVLISQLLADGEPEPNARVRKAPAARLVAFQPSPLSRAKPAPFLTELPLATPKL
jgi:hypothetical protein